MSSLPSASEPQPAWQICPAGPDDAPGIARVHVLSWQSAYKGLLPQAMLDQLSLATRERQWRQWLEAPAGSAPDTLVATSDQGILGFVSGGALRGDHPGFDSEIAAIYLLPAQQGKGLGKALFEAMQAQLRAAGYQRCLVWVLASNATARAFYARQGGSPALTKTASLGTSFGAEPVEVEEVGYAFELSKT